MLLILLFCHSFIVLFGCELIIIVYFFGWLHDRTEILRLIKGIYASTNVADDIHRMSRWFSNDSFHKF